MKHTNMHKKKKKRLKLSMLSHTVMVAHSHPLHPVPNAAADTAVHAAPNR